MRKIFTTEPFPSRATVNKLSSEIGLPFRVIKVWFQNERAKKVRRKGSTDDSSSKYRSQEYHFSNDFRSSFEQHRNRELIPMNIEENNGQFRFSQKVNNPQFVASASSSSAMPRLRPAPSFGIYPEPRGRDSSSSNEERNSSRRFSDNESASLPIFKRSPQIGAESSSSTKIRESHIQSASAISQVLSGESSRHRGNSQHHYLQRSGS